MNRTVSAPPPAPDILYMKEALKEANEGIRAGEGGPFGCVIVKGDRIAGRGHNRVILKRDPTCHGEMEAIRDACKTLGTYDLAGCVLYTTAEPCPMCLAAMHMSGVAAVRFCYSNDEAEAFGLSTAAIYAQMAMPLDAQAIDIRQQAVPCDGPSLYAVWKSRQAR